MLMIRAAGLFDGDRFLPGPATVIIDGARIAGVEQGWPEPPEHAEVLDLGEETVLPGLVDTHVHLVGDSGWGPSTASPATRRRTCRGWSRSRCAVSSRPG